MDSEVTALVIALYIVSGALAYVTVPAMVVLVMETVRRYYEIHYPDDVEAETRDGVLRACTLLAAYEASGPMGYVVAMLIAPAYVTMVLGLVLAYVVWTGMLFIAKRKA